MALDDYPGHAVRVEYSEASARGGGCRNCRWHDHDGLCGHPTHSRFQSVPDAACPLYRYDQEPAPAEPMTRRNEAVKGVPSGYRRCTKCGRVLPLEDFPKNKACAGGHRPECRPCRRDAEAVWYAKHAEDNRARGEELEREGAVKRCKACGEMKPITAFYRNSRSKDGHMAVCRDCDKARAVHRLAQRRM